MAAIYSRMSATEQTVYKDFFKQTDEANIVNYSKGSSLTDLVSQADKITSILQDRNPIWGDDQENVTEARQWQLDRLSEVKTRLSQAIVQKQSYYENTLLGMITKFVLKCFGQWNNGNTNAINTAEDFLLSWDSRAPMQEVDGTYKIRDPIFFDADTSIGWVRENLDLSQFYNYTPTRTIKFTGDYGHVDAQGKAAPKPYLPPVFVQIDTAPAGSNKAFNPADRSAIIVKQVKQEIQDAIGQILNKADVSKVKYLLTCEISGEKRSFEVDVSFKQGYMEQSITESMGGIETWLTEQMKIHGVEGPISISGHAFCLTEDNIHICSWTGTDTSTKDSIEFNTSNSTAKPDKEHWKEYLQLHFQKYDMPFPEQIQAPADFFAHHFI